MRPRLPRLRSLALITLLGSSVASRADAESVEGPGFRLVVPAGFERAAEEVERGMEDGLVAQRQQVGVWTDGRPRVWIYVKTYAVGEAKLVVNREPRRTPPADDPEFLRGQRIGLDQLVKAQGGTVEAPRARTTAAGLLVSEGRARLAPGTPDAVDVFMAVLPREGFGVAVSLYAKGQGREDVAATWEGLLAGLASEAPPPPPGGRTGLSKEAIEGYLMAGLVLVGATIAFVWSRRARRAKRRRWEEEDRRLREEFGDDAVSL